MYTSLKSVIPWYAVPKSKHCVGGRTHVAEEIEDTSIKGVI